MSDSSPSLSDIATMLDAKNDKFMAQVREEMTRRDSALREEMTRRDSALREEMAREREEAAKRETRMLVRFGGIVVGVVALHGVFTTAFDMRDTPSTPVSPITVQIPPTIQYAPPPATNGNGTVQR